MNLSLLVSLLSITFVKPVPLSPFGCDNSACNLVYTPPITMSRLAYCECSKNMHTFVYNAGPKALHLNYNLTYPVTHDFYQNNTLIGSCSEGSLCNQYFHLNPSKELRIVINETFSNEYRDNSYNLFLYP